jgi:hypothetical protein
VNNLSACPYGDGSQKIPDEKPEAGAFVCAARRDHEEDDEDTGTGAAVASCCFVPQIIRGTQRQS